MDPGEGWERGGRSAARPSGAGDGGDVERVVDPEMPDGIPFEKRGRRTRAEDAALKLCPICSYAFRVHPLEREAQCPHCDVFLDVPPEPATQEGPLPVEKEVRRFNWFSPDPQARRGRLSFDTKRGGQWVAGIILWAAVVLMALNMAGSVVMWVEDARTDEESGPTGITAGVIWVGGAIVLLMFGLPPLVWVAAFYRGAAAAWAHALFLRFRRPLVNTGWGVLAAIGMLAFSILVNLALQALGRPPENPLMEEMALVVTWPLVFWIAFTAAVGEELFFRGLLQPRIGIVASAVLFGLAHLSWGVPIQVVMPFIFGFVLSFLVVLTRSLLSAIVAHFCYNFAAGAALIAARETGEFDFAGLTIALF